MQCGACTGVCPWGEVTSYSPRKILRDISLDKASNVSVDEASWTCATCNSCVEQCPRGIGLLDLIKSIRRHVVDAGFLPKSFDTPVKSLKKERQSVGRKKGKSPGLGQGRNAARLYHRT